MATIFKIETKWSEFLTLYDRKVVLTVKWFILDLNNRIIIIQLYINAWFFLIHDLFNSQDSFNFFAFPFLYYSTLIFDSTPEMNPNFQEKIEFRQLPVQNCNKLLLLINVWT